ncbi:TPA: TIGR01440 family protein [Streptococcus suis]
MAITSYKTDLINILDQVLDKAQLQKGDLFVLGCSTSEVLGASIGQGSSQEIGDMIVETILNKLKPLGVYLAVQGCEHLNRSLVVEAAYAQAKDLEEVWVMPSLHAGGACSVAAFKLFDQPVEVAQVKAKAGLDIGDTFIGMHIKQVLVPIRPSIKQLGSAHVTACSSRPKYVGGPRASYPDNNLHIK